MIKYKWSLPKSWSEQSIKNKDNFVEDFSVNSHFINNNKTMRNRKNEE